jgi:S-formylglutathione hydrolase
MTRTYVEGGAFRAAAELGIAIVVLTPASRGENVPMIPTMLLIWLTQVFYLNATQKPWSTHFTV